MFQSVIVKNTFASIASVVVVRVVILSVRTHSGCSVYIAIDRKGACNRGKGSFVILIMSVQGQLRPL